ncbi:MAG: peptidoglycan-binding protein [Clostridiales bacterium]|nr:peptidoglycan-binding protein [Clostridiales bacterium]
MNIANLSSKSNKKDKAIRIYPTELGTQSLGRLQIHCVTPNIAPVQGATVRITSPAQPTVVLEEITTDISGLTPEIELPAPPIDYSLDPSAMVQPYSEYNIFCMQPDYTPVSISNMQVLADVTAIQDATMRVSETPEAEGSVYVISPHTLWGDFPPKIAEPEINPAAETGEIVLSRVVIPEFVIVHDGPPTDASAANHYVRFTDYIKNVACSEIYATWPEATIQANVLAILSFTLNRVFTEWYRNQGFNFTVTSSTAFDHKWVPGRNIFSNIGIIVDSLFVNYLSRPNIRQPILTQYCDGKRVQCPNWMTQWGSKDLGDQGYDAISILRHFYGDSIFINTAPQVSGVPASWPGQNLNIGASGNNVRMIQEQLNAIANVYTQIPKVAVNGQYNEQTAEAVRTFQSIFNMPATGIVDFPTWYRISGIYVAVTRMAEG